MENIDIKKYLPFAYIVGSIIVLIILISWIITPKYASFELNKTPFITENFTSFSNGKLYNYNGAAFYSVNPKDPNDVSVLSTGLRLPAVQKLYWAEDKGALVVFGDTQTDGSLVEKELTARGKAFDVVTTSYTWYLDFKTNSLHLVSDTPVDSYNAYYSPSKQAFYFSTLPLHQDHGADEGQGPTLWTYSIDTRERKALIAGINSDLVRYIGPCTGREVCIIQDEKPDKQTIWTVNDGKKKVIANTYNSVSSTGDPSVFLAEKNERAGGAGGAEDAELQADLFVLNVEKNEEKATAIRVGVGVSPTASSYDKGKKLVLYDDSLLTDNKSTFRNIAPDLFGTLQSKQEAYRLTGNDELTEDITGILSRSTEGISVIGGSEGGVYLHSPSSYNYAPETYNEKTLKKALKPCTDKYTKYYEYAPEIRQATIGIVFDDNFASTVKKFSSCIASTDKKAFVGQNYIFIGLSPIDGRFVTN